MVDRSIPIKLNGRLIVRESGSHIEAELPAILRAASRSLSQPGSERTAVQDPFFPDGYLSPTASFDVGVSARSAADGVSEKQHDAAPNEVIVFELSDGSTFITSAQRLHDTLKLTHPEFIAEDGSILLEKLRADGAAPRGFLADVAGGLISKVFTFIVGAKPDSIINQALQTLGSPERIAELGVSWAGTKALMWAIEDQLSQKPGLYKWESETELKALPPDFDQPMTDELAKKPMLVFLHGTGSSTFGSFSELRGGDRNLWGTLERTFTGGIYAFEHRTLSESPIENAIALASALPPSANVSLVSHSRGGLVADLLCLNGFEGLIDNYKYRFEGTGDADPDEAIRVIAEMDDAHAEQRKQLSRLATVLRKQKLNIQRYVRVAAPANGTRLASGNFDLFLSGVLTLIGQVPFFFGNPLYSAFKRVVIEIAKNRTNPHLIPGIEAMLPDSPMARLLRDAPVQNGIVMAVIAGDIEGGNLLKRLGVLLTDFLLFDNSDHDLVVDTVAMLAGIAPTTQARALFDRGPDVSHFRYFINSDTRTALRDWLTVTEPVKIEAFRPLPTKDEYRAALNAAMSRDVLVSTDRPVVVILPGVMGSHLRVGGSDRVWFDPLDIAGGGLTKVAWGKPNVEAEELFSMSYGKLCAELIKSHRVERFAYDWRQPLDVLAERLGEFLTRLMRETKQPIRLLAHSMGGLVVRAAIYKRRSVMDALMQREGSRFIMLGTPNQGAHSMVENLLGKGDTLRTLVRIDITHDMQEVLDIVSGFRGALQLLPRRGFKDTFQGQADGGTEYSIWPYDQENTWQTLKQKNIDFWFGNHRCGTPAQSVLEEATWLWKQDGLTTPSLPPEYESRSVYVYGIARNTACGVREVDGHLKMVGTTRGDGTVTWDSGRIGGVGSSYYMAAEHGNLAATEEHFPALIDLLTSGATNRLPQSPPALRAIEQPVPVTYDAGPPTADDADTLERSLMGGALRNRVPPRSKRRLEISVKAMDLRFLSQPIMVGHYEQDPIAGPEALIDHELLAGDLSERHSMGLYAGPRGTAAVVLRAPNELERRRGSLIGAVVTGLGKYDGALSLSDLTEAVRAGALRYLLQVVDVLGKADREVPLATLLLGYNSSANLTVAASVEALVRGVVEANAKFFETTRLNIRIARLDIVELYRDTAITAVYALRQLSERLSAFSEKLGTMLICRNELEQGDGVRPRLFDSRNASYWPRMIVTDARRSDGSGLTVGSSGNVALPNDAARTGVADSLRFLFVGQRARAESVVQQRQPGLIEQLVQQQIHNTAWQPDFGRMLFQLMVPHDFKDAARQLDRLVLVVDSTTANLPWELMLADDPARGNVNTDDQLPLALRTAVVRQLSSTVFRRQVRQTMERTALVIGNPSTRGFASAFSTPACKRTDDPVALPDAYQEAVAVGRVLSGMGYKVTPEVMTDGAEASEVLALLYRQPYRIVHVSAHGVFNLQHADGYCRSGVLLSGGLLMTAAEVAAMEVVPELVFLNCCHLGQIDIKAADKVDGVNGDGNKLAASLARELIEIGVRCVIVAGWAVNDQYARLFGEVFYQRLLLDRLPFGEAVLKARLAVWDQSLGSDITWGAFQAYGDPGWLAEARPAGHPMQGAAEMHYVSPEELLDDLARLRADLSRKRDFLSDREMRAQVAMVKETLDKRCPSAWMALPQLQSALGAAWYDLGQFEPAREALLKAIQAEDKNGQVPIHDIEKLANVEARLGEKQAEAELEKSHAAGTKGAKNSEALIDQALQRLAGLDALVSGQADAFDPASYKPVYNAERSALRGGAWKRKASLQARRILKGLSADDLKKVSQQMDESLANSIAAYRSAEGSPGSLHFSAYLALNRLALDALTAWPDQSSKDAAIALAEQCKHSAEQGFSSNNSIWGAVMQAEAQLVERLLDGRLGAEGEEGQAAFDELVEAYTESMSNIVIKPSQIDSIVTQMELLSRFCDARSLVLKESLTDAPNSGGGSSAPRHESLWRMADRLLELVQSLSPGRPARTDRPSMKRVGNGSSGKSRQSVAKKVVAKSPVKVADKNAAKSAAKSAKKVAKKSKKS